MKPGFKIPASGQSLLPDKDVSDAAGLQQLRAAVDRLAHETPTAPHPLLGKMAPEEVGQLHLRHCELHMSFVVPNFNGEAA
jgi:hypothetical protein